MLLLGHPCYVRHVLTEALFVSLYSISEAPGGVLDARPPTPQAPRHGPKPPHARIPLAEMNAIVAPLFQGPRDTPHRPPGLPRPTFKAVASHRVLFNEEEFRQAGAQPTLEVTS